MAAILRGRCAGSGCLKDQAGRLHLRQSARAALERKLVAAPEIHIPVLVDVRGTPGLLGGKPAVRNASAISAEPVRVVIA